MVRLPNVEDDRDRLPDGELRRLRMFWLHVIALAVADQDEAWLRGTVPCRNLILEAAGLEPGYWDRIMLPVADAIRAERELAQVEDRTPRPILPPGAAERKVLRRWGLGVR